MRQATRGKNVPKGASPRSRAMTCKWGTWGLAACALVLASSCTQETQTSTQAPTQAATQSAQAPIVETFNAATVQDRVAQRYSSPDSFRWTLEVYDGPPNANPAKKTAVIAGKRPNLLRVEEPEATLIVNGGDVLLLLTEEQMAIRMEFEGEPNSSDLTAADPTLAAMLDKYLHLDVIEDAALLSGDTNPGLSPNDSTIALFHPTNDPLGDEICVQAADGLMTWAKKFTDARPEKAFYIRTASEELNPVLEDALFSTEIPDGFADASKDYRGEPRGRLATELEGKPAPLFSLPTLEGETLALADQRGKVAVLDFWASWCTLCIEGMPTMASLAGSVDPDKTVVWGVNFDEGEEGRFLAAEAVEKTEAFYPQLIVQDVRLLDEYMVGPLPMLVIVGEDGIVKKVHLGPVPGVEELKAMIEEAR
ncbi:MAG: hypothetical protein PWP23_1760 [Candidatus Sumerlaeota bacterium]|nr:hypothetical protein [Candidatus Sumerlaeota bacterium]